MSDLVQDHRLHPQVPLRLGQILAQLGRVRPDGVLAARGATRTTDYLQRLLGGALPLPQPARTDVSGRHGVHPEGVLMTPAVDV